MRRLFVLLLLATSCRMVAAGGNTAVHLFSSPQKVNREKKPVQPDARLAVIWIGHASVLIQMDDKVILADPVFTDTVAQLSKRLVEPGVDPKDLPKVDLAVISHLHQDHYSLGSLEMIEPKLKTLLLPSGGLSQLTGWFNFPAHELRTWQVWEKDGLRATAVPVEHPHFRYGIDYEWMPEGAATGWMLEYHGLKVYFGGDAAYDQKNYVQVGERFPKIDLALLPIGPIEPHSYMRKIHMDPAEAVQAFIDLNAARMVPIHHSTFPHSTDAPGEELRQLDTASKRWSLHGTITPLPIGERRVFIKAEKKP